LGDGRFWFAGLTPSERSTFWGCFGGWALDALDVQIYTFAIPALMAVWGITRPQAGDLASATLLCSAAGGWLAGLLCDRIGRVRTLQFAILWFAVFTFLCALAQNFTQFAVCRGLMGFGFGGEWTAGAVLMGETIRPALRGRAVGTMQSGWAIGWAIADLLSVLCLGGLPEAIGWRALFAFGLVPALLVLYLRRRVREPEVFMRQQRERGRPLDIFRPPVLRTTLLAVLLSVGAQGGYYALTVWLPTFLRVERGYSLANSGAFVAVTTAGAFAGYLAGAHLADRLGRRGLMIAFGIGASAFAGVYMLLPLPDPLLFAMGFPLGFFSCGYFAGTGAFLTELFATRNRGNAQGFCYNAGRGIAALLPGFIATLSTGMPLGRAIGLVTVCAYGLLCTAAYLLPETAGRELE
jgi:MFS family permease